jgi:ATP-binding cassette subfamily B protein
LDEPLANLDTTSRALAASEIFRRTEGRMLVMIMHNADELMPKFDRIHVLGEISENVMAAR